LLEKPSTGPALLELRKIQDTMIGNLLGFMNAFNLRFGPATTPSQKQVYSRLFEILDQTRDQILAEAKIDAKSPPETTPKNAIDFFERVGKESSRPGSGTPPPTQKP
jgi:hypothetical protein